MAESEKLGFQSKVELSIGGQAVLLYVELQSELTRVLGSILLFLGQVQQPKSLKMVNSFVLFRTL
jgi:hypothetical protein